jgi:hypothetical protein
LDVCRAVPTDIISRDQNRARFVVVQKGLELADAQDDSGGETNENVNDSVYKSATSSPRHCPKYYL